MNTPEAFDGYTLVAPSGATRTHLIDNCGRIVNQWDSEYRPGQVAYLLEDGSLLRAGREASTVFNGGGIGGRIERFSWEGDLIWSYSLANDTAHHHHDLAWLPNGNVVLIAWEYKSEEEAMAVGREGEGPLWPPMIVEIEPEGAEGGNVVWEWHAWDHLIQHVDSALPHFGEPAEHPTRFNINYGAVSGGGFPGGSAGGDWFHCNGLAYHPGLDQLMLNSRNWNEFYIIDHSTTTEEAAGPAGDLLYRWGNPQTYNRGTAEDRLLYQQHDAHWIVDEGPSITGSDPGFTALIYNNGNGRPSGDGSSVDELLLPWDGDGDSGLYTLPPDDGSNAPFAPGELDWSWPELPSMDFHSHNVSGCQRLPNGNTLICEGNKGKLFEITPEGEIVWQYITAYSQFGPIAQGDNPIGNGTFRAYRYGPEYPAFEGRDLTPGDPVEGNPWPSDCEVFPAPVDTGSTTGISDADGPTLLFGPNPADASFTISSDERCSWTLRDMTGRPVSACALPSRQHEISTAELPAGIMLLQVTDIQGRPLGAPRRILIRH